MFHRQNPVTCVKFNINWQLFGLSDYIPCLLARKLLCIIAYCVARQIGIPRDTCKGPLVNL